MFFHQITARAVSSLAILVTPVALGDDFSADPDWKFSVYLWATGLEGELGIGAVEEQVDLGFSDLLSSLDIGGSFAARRDWGRNLLLGDISYFALSSDTKTGSRGNTISAGLDLSLLSAYYGRKWGTENKHGGILFGARYMNLDLTLIQFVDGPAPGSETRERAADPDFTNLLVGAWGSVPLNEDWDLDIQGDIGAGGSDNSWNLQMLFRRELHSGNTLTVGARVLGIDFEDSLPNGEVFVMDARMAGAVLGFTWD